MFHIQNSNTTELFSVTEDITIFMEKNFNYTCVGYDLEKSTCLSNNVEHHSEKIILENIPLFYFDDFIANLEKNYPSRLNLDDKVGYRK